ncbi:hypothetical protein CBM2599_A120512 [Cupriavidus taiwanensis]|uniref:hypothetical protein n=1 Tax=Cupriavidus taiwanensis TaxID=164546 RepID=UPI000E183682|nr:hypothetical protein [Cupriavidus taiwanensis]SOY79947.1 hypothetical protein CBM2599_A120512 [Cupriavidus taiwanensis]SOY81916.1 hypothetical protein CBM2600_A120534 [Cupriavidus taiwanensis]
MKPKTTKCPSAPYVPLKLDLATRLAQAKAAKDQPPLTSLASSVQSHRPGEGWK